MKITNLGMPNVYNSLIKKAVEGFWSGKNTEKEIYLAEEKVILSNIDAQARLRLHPVFDIDIYDRMLRTAVMFGIVPKRFGTPEQANNDVGVYLSIPRGTENAAASPMVKWFNTNYHVVQPEIEHNPYLVKKPDLPAEALDHWEWQKLALIGPCTLLSYSLNKTTKTKDELFEVLSEQYVNLINSLSGIHHTIQLEEPSFLTNGIPKDYDKFLEKLNRTIHLHVYFGAVNTFADKLFSMPVSGIGMDFVDGSSNLELLEKFPKDKELIAGIINGRNVWPASLRTKETLDSILEKINETKLYLSPSCSLMHVPLTAKDENCDFSFALEKLDELAAIRDGSINYNESFQTNDKLPEKRFERSRKNLWVSKIPYPTTTIGSFPQTPELRKVRNDWKSGKIPEDNYNDYIKWYIRDCIRKQEELGLDVLVHGEPERADMVQYFAENLEGFTPIKGAVQSYGTRHVKPPVVTGTIKRLKPFTVEWIAYAQSFTDKPVKGMLTGPVTLVQWAYPREDISKEAQFYEFARALSEEVNDLVKAGVKHIQIDEPALREGLPIDQSKCAHYLNHALNAFRLVYAKVPDDIVIHSHMCFSEFPDIMDAIRDMGVDVLSIEDSKAKGKTALSLMDGKFPGSIGLGVYDVHSPRLPSLDEMLEIPSSLEMDPCRIWINPDCGLKTRGKEAYTQLELMMKVAYILRKNK